MPLPHTFPNSKLLHDNFMIFSMLNNVMYGRPYVRQRRTRDIRRARERAEHAQEATAAGSNG
jgi:hypothetical protein